MPEEVLMPKGARYNEEFETLVDMMLPKEADRMSYGLSIRSWWLVVT